MEPTLKVGQRVLVNRIDMHFKEPHIGEIMVFHPPKDAEQQVCGPAASHGHPRRRGLLDARARRGQRQLHQAGRGGARRRHDLHQGRSRLCQRQASREDSYIDPVRWRLRVQFPEADQDTRRSLVHDGGQSWRVGRQQVLGTCPHKLDHRRGFRHLLASRPHRLPLRIASQAPALPGLRTLGASLVVARAARADSVCSPSIARLGCRMVAGADEAGRGCLAGPLVAAAVLFDYEQLTTRELRALASAERLQAAQSPGSRGALSARAQQRGARHRRLALRAAGSTRAVCTRRIWRLCATRSAASRAAFRAR